MSDDDMVVVPVGQTVTIDLPASDWRWTSEPMPDGSTRHERADGRVIEVRPRVVPAMTPERLAELRAYADDLRPLADRADAAKAVVDLLAEVDRLRALLVRIRPDVVREESIDAIDEALRS